MGLWVIIITIDASNCFLVKLGLTEMPKRLLWNTFEVLNRIYFVEYICRVKTVIMYHFSCIVLLLLLVNPEISLGDSYFLLYKYVEPCGDQLKLNATRFFVCFPSYYAILIYQKALRILGWTYYWFWLARCFNISFKLWGFLQKVSCGLILEGFNEVVCSCIYLTSIKRIS